VSDLSERLFPEGWCSVTAIVEARAAKSSTEGEGCDGGLLWLPSDASECKLSNTLQESFGWVSVDRMYV
jgi:hypothetical protein